MMMLQANAIPGLSVSETSEFLLAETGLTNIRYTILAGTIGLVNQAFIMGSTSQLVVKYFQKHKNDPALARVGVIWMTAMVFLSSLITNTIQARLILMSSQFTSGFMMDYWLNQLANLIFAIVLFPVLMFFAFRAWNLWSRRRIIMVVCVVALVPTTILGIAAAAIGLKHPFPLDTMNNEDFNAWLPFFMVTTRNAKITTLSATALQFVTSSIFSGLICAGLFFHRQCCGLMPGLASKIQFVVGESLLPLVLTSLGLLIGEVLSMTYSHPAGGLLSRALRYAAPAIYFHCLMTSLCSPQRHRDDLRREFENMVEDQEDPYLPEKGLVGAASPGSAFDAQFHPDDLDTPLQVDIKSPFTNPPSTLKNGKKNNSGTSSYHHRYAGNPKLSPSPLITMKRPSFSFRSSFLGGSGNNISPKDEKSPSKPGSRRSSGDKEYMNVSQSAVTDLEIQTRGQGRRSSLAVAAANSSMESNSILPISIKLNGSNKKSSNKSVSSLLPSVSIRPGKGMGRRESENIFVAHEEFDNLPDMPGDELGELGSIEEVNSDSAGTPKFYTPTIGPQSPRTPTPNLPIPSPLPSPAPGATSSMMSSRNRIQDLHIPSQGDTEHWGDIGRAH